MAEGKVIQTNNQTEKPVNLRKGHSWTACYEAFSYVTSLLLRE